MLACLRQILTRVCARLVSIHYSAAISYQCYGKRNTQHFEIESDTLLDRLNYIVNYIPQQDIITNFAQECRYLKMQSRGMDYELHDVVSFIADFDYLFGTIRFNREWHAEISQILNQSQI